jgi:hypothetical protein
MFKVEEAKWELIAERKLLLMGTKITIVYVGGGIPYHIHREDACHGMTDSLALAKLECLVVVAELMEMGVDP